MITSTFRFRGLVPDVEEDLVCMMCFDKEKNAYKETNGYQYIQNQREQKIKVKDLGDSNLGFLEYVICMNSFH